MTTMWIIILVWLALQLPLAVLIGKAIKFGTVGPEKRRTPAKAPEILPGSGLVLNAGRPFGRRRGR